MWQKQLGLSQRCRVCMQLEIESDAKTKQESNFLPGLLFCGDQWSRTFLKITQNWAVGKKGRHGFHQDLEVVMDLQDHRTQPQRKWSFKFCTSFFSPFLCPIRTSLCRRWTLMFIQWNLVNFILFGKPARKTKCIQVCSCSFNLLQIYCIFHVKLISLKFQTSNLQLTP